MKQILIFIAKIIGRVWVFAAIPFRKYARSVVYNYVLQNNLPLKRLYERNPQFVAAAGGWILDDVHELERFSPGKLGFIKWRKVNKIQFYLVVFLIWGWLDDDSNEDTTDKGYIRTLKHGQRKIIPFTPLDLIVKLSMGRLRKISWTNVVYGNAFDLGDVRADHPFFNFFATLAWNNRNTAMNFQYLFTNY